MKNLYISVQVIIVTTYYISIIKSLVKTYSYILTPFNISNIAVKVYDN